MTNKRRGRRPQRRNNRSRRRGGSNSPLIIGIIAGAVLVLTAAVIGLVLLLSGSGGNSPKGAVKAYYKTIADGDAYGIEAHLPPAGLAILEDEGGLGKSGRYIERMMEDGDCSGTAAQDRKFFGCGSISIDVQEINTVSLSEVGGTSMLGDVEEVAACKVRLSCGDRTETRTIYTVKVDGKWYCVNAANIIWSIL